MSSLDNRLAPSERAAVIAAMKGRETVRPAAPAEPASPGRPARTAFDTLPGYAEIRTQRAVGSMIGLHDPFYAPHAVRAGARSEVDGRPVVNFASYDYLGLNGHPEITAAVAEAAATWGTSVSASRITAGERAFHRELERGLARLHRTEAALAFVSGHATAVSTVAALVGPRDLVIHDALIHNCVVMGAQLSGATRRVVPHNDCDSLEALLGAERDAFERVLIVVEGLYSMDGDHPDLGRLVAIKRRFDAWLMVDEAHSVGVLGATGCGLWEETGVDPSGVDIWLGTLSKTLVSCGGYVAGSATLIDYLKFAAAGMVYSVGMPATAAVASIRALELMTREPERIAALRANGRRFAAAARAAGLDLGPSLGFSIAPVILGDTIRAVVLADRLLRRGINAVPIIPPGVPEKSARLRFFLSAAHTEEEIDRAVAATAEELVAITQAGLSLATVADWLKR